MVEEIILNFCREVTDMSWSQRNSFFQGCSDYQTKKFIIQDIIIKKKNHQFGVWYFIETKNSLLDLFYGIKNNEKGYLKDFIYYEYTGNFEELIDKITFAKMKYL